MTIPSWVLQAYGFADGAEVTRLGGGIINDTYAVRHGEARVVIQRVHPVFPKEKTLDLADVTAHLAGAGFPTFTVVRTTDGALFLPDGDHHWRALTWLDSTGRMPSPGEAGRTLGRFHEAMAGYTGRFRVERHIHRPLHHLHRLVTAIESHGDHPLHREVVPLAHEISERLQDLASRVDLSLTAVVHGDPKLENFLEIRGAGWTLVDLDTVGENPVLAELGDAMRSWCNEGDSFSQERFREGLDGYLATSPYRLKEKDVLHATALIAWELAARFAYDALEESYFAWDPAAYPSRGHHNLARARRAAAYARTVDAAL